MLGNVDLKFYLSIFLRRLPYFIVIAAFVSAVGIAVASILPPIYRSTRHDPGRGAADPRRPRAHPPCRSTRSSRSRSSSSG